jgi:pimeloyl-ACP methyl ester carboxylesterase
VPERDTAAGRSDPGPSFVAVPDGRRIAYDQFGAPDGRPVIYAHGFPSSRREALLLHKAAAAAGARIITSDRPGYGDSDDQPGRHITDWPDDVLRLADHLGLERFALLGVSGGGPYALAGAWRLPAQAPGRLAGCALVCPLGPIYRPELLGAMNPVVQANLAVGKGPPWLAGLVFGPPTTAVLAHWPQMVERVRHVAAPDADRAVLAEGDTAAILNATIADAMRNGAPGARRDLNLYVHDWDLPFADVHQPIDIWHGGADGTVPVAHARWYAAQLPHASLHELAGEGHYSVPLRHTPRILARLLAAFDSAASGTRTLAPAGATPPSMIGDAGASQSDGTPPLRPGRKPV